MKRLHRKGLAVLLLLTLTLAGCKSATEKEEKEEYIPTSAPTKVPTKAPTAEPLRQPTEAAGQNEITPEVTIPDPGHASEPIELVDISTAIYTYESCCKDILYMERRYKDIVSVLYEGVSRDGRPIPAVLFGNPKAGKTIFIQASIHGREYMSTLLVMKLLARYAETYEEAVYNGEAIRDIFSEVNLLVVPMSNPDGVSISQIGPACIRNPELRELLETIFSASGAADKRAFFRRFKANAAGVDLNRNFAYGFQEYVGVSAPAADHYKGTEPGSEPETKLLMKLTEEYPVVAALSYHATGSVLYWDFLQEGAIREKCEKLMETVRELTGYTPAYAATNRQDEAGYCEWAVGMKGIPEVTIEIGKNAAPLAIEEFADIFERNKDVFAAVAKQFQ